MPEMTAAIAGSTAMLQIGDPAPNFRARTTMGVKNLSDFRGRWLVLFSHPADFTPVCTSEFVALARASDRFNALGCDLLAVSVDSLYSHLAWIKAIRESFDVTVSFPIVEDPSLVIGRAYGMISDRSPDAATMRSTYFIDPEGTVRAMISYPATVGRSVEEMLRVLAALQRIDIDNVVTPEGWHPGDDVLLPPYQDQASLIGGMDDPRWFCRIRPDRKGGDSDGG
ncbi:MAG: peroxiredoxin [Candidatus Andeanibacterium colombiense]|uniref:Thioredoxin peroxidase n=1 Tax=Candidatus Andeanibacterium colombiense TaxID=3121345 RepID=A0AAJ6BQ46_9SPHN|nr:MAG: peroxiredoxin [Sphingomonadaceae bacterium]